MPVDWPLIRARILLRSGYCCEWPQCRAPNADENLAAWCQLHHLAWDRDLHAQHARGTRQRKREEAACRQLPLFPNQG